MATLDKENPASAATIIKNDVIITERYNPRVSWLPVLSGVPDRNHGLTMINIHGS